MSLCNGNENYLYANIEAEMGVLAALILDPSWFALVREALPSGADEFHREAHQEIYRALLALHDAGRPIDATLLAAELDHRNALVRLGPAGEGRDGGIDYLGNLTQSVGSPANAVPYAQIVHEHAVKRETLADLEEMRHTIVSNGKTAAQVSELLSNRANRIADLLTIDAPEIDIRPWPDAGKPELLYGLAGDIVRLIAPHTESDPMAILGQFLVGFGNLVGRGPHWRVESTRHGCNLFACVVGSTSKARKGTSWDNVRWILSRCDDEWSRNQVLCGMSTGEGLIYTVRDPVTKREKVGAIYEEREVDPGVVDKRACWVESEFESVLACMGRDANTLNAVIRQAYDGHQLRVATKNSPNRATDAHISIIGHITDEALRAKLTRTDTANGFANRFLWLCARRSRYLPHGGYMGREQAFPELIRRVEDAVRFARVEFDADCAPIGRTHEANRLWEQVYPKLSSSRPGMLGMVTSRAEAQVMRLAVIYALLDLEKWVRPDHLRAALAFWDYCDSSAAYIFGDALGDPDAEKLLTAIRDAGEGGLTPTDIRRKVFRGYVDVKAIGTKIDILVRAGLVQQVDAPNGRRAKVWVAL